ncbi:E3 ubiquitin-protein ligase RNF170-like [Lampetra fluviatilis]
MFIVGPRDAAPADTERDIREYNSRFSGQPRPWLDYLRDLPTILRHASRELFSLSGLVWMFRARVSLLAVGGLLYVAAPLDIVPEAAFGLLGLLDDLLIVALLLLYVSVIYLQHVAQQAARHE